MLLYAHPFSSYCQKVLIALYENGTDFEWRLLDRTDPMIGAEFERRWPLKHMPMLVDGEHTLTEASIIIEHLDRHHSGSARLIPEDPDVALQVRWMDRCFDNYVMTPMQRIVYDAIRAPADRHPISVAEARSQLRTSYAWLEAVLKAQSWAVGDRFSLADCAAAPALFYADWVEPIAPELEHLRAYRARLLARPSFARAVDEARPFRANFPCGAPDRD